MAFATRPAVLSTARIAGPMRTFAQALEAEDLLTGAVGDCFVLVGKCYQNSN